MRYHISNVILVCAVCAIAGPLHAADISFGPPLPAGSASTDFVLGGTLDRAYAFGSPIALDINGIHFTPFPNSSGDSTTLDAAYDAYLGDGQTGAYGSLLMHGLFHDNDARTVSLTNLHVGAVYTLEVVGSGLRARSDCCQAGAGYNNLFRVSGDSPNGGGTIEWGANDASSRHIYGTFIADKSGSQTLNLNAFGAINPLSEIAVAQIHGIVLSYTAVPEPTSLALFGVCALGIATATRRRSP